MSTEDGFPLNVVSKSNLFLQSELFSNMVTCIAAQIRLEISTRTPEESLDSVSVFLATDAIEVKECLARQLSLELRKHFSEKKLRLNISETD